MPERIYYIDTAQGDDTQDGLSPGRPLRSYAPLTVRGGDTVLFKRGSMIRDTLRTSDGEPGAPITYGAYGEGEKPTFLGSVAAGDPGRWVEERHSLWRYVGSFPSEVCNIVFDDGASCGNLRFGLDDLQNDGEWYYTDIGTASSRESGAEGTRTPGVLYLVSSGNPGHRYRSIECSLWANRKLVSGKRHIIIENLCFRNSGVHGYQESHPIDVTIRGCDFRCIGGAVWDLAHRVRFGNAVELWDGAEDVTVEGCLFDNIYDAGVTHQGGGVVSVPERIYFRDNLFIDCGLAAYECREPSRDIYFEHNTCITSGGGFAMQGEPPPRKSEIYVKALGNGHIEMKVIADGIDPSGPQPIDVGHHVLVWRVERNTQPGQVYIRRNVFHETPHGAAIYAIIDEEDMRRFVIDENCYSPANAKLLAYYSGRTYGADEFDRYREECGQDASSRLEKPRFVCEAQGDFRIQEKSSCAGAGVRPHFSPGR